MLPLIIPPGLDSDPTTMRIPLPTTGNRDHDESLRLVVRALQLGHAQLAYQRGWQAYLAGRPLPANEHELAGYMAAFHELCYAGDATELDEAPTRRGERAA